MRKRGGNGGGGQCTRCCDEGGEGGEIRKDGTLKMVLDCLEVVYASTW